MVIVSSPLDWTRWPNFSEREFACKGSGLCKMHPGFMDRLQALRTEFGKALRVTSGYRSPAHNAAVSSTKSASGPHTTGRAVDLAVSHEDAYRLLALALKHGFTGIGIAQKGEPKTRFIHLDDLTPADGHTPRPTIWSY